MVETASNVAYLRFILHQETDSLLLARKRPASLTFAVPEVREIRALLRALIAQGVEKIRLAGDDPALREDLADVVGMVAGLDGVQEIAMTTRGLGLVGHVGALAKRGLNGINFDLDTLSAERYQALTGSSRHSEVETAIDQALGVGMKVKLNVVLQRGINDDETDQWVALTRKRPVQVRFIEWNAGAGMLASPDRFLSARETMAIIKPSLVPQESSSRDGPALVYGIPNHEGTIGFVPNITEHFCDTCTRIGLTDTGEIMSCIFGRGLSLIRHLRGPGGMSSVSAFVDRVLRRKQLLASKFEGFPGAALPAEASEAVQTLT